MTVKSLVHMGKSRLDAFVWHRLDPGMAVAVGIASGGKIFQWTHSEHWCKRRPVQRFSHKNLIAACRLCAAFASWALSKRAHERKGHGSGIHPVGKVSAPSVWKQITMGRRAFRKSQKSVQNYTNQHGTLCASNHLFRLMFRVFYGSKIRNHTVDAASMQSLF